MCSRDGTLAWYPAVVRCSVTGCQVEGGRIVRENEDRLHVTILSLMPSEARQSWSTAERFGPKWESPGPPSYVGAP